MREGFSYTYIAGDRHTGHTGHVDLRRFVVDRVKRVCNDKEIAFQVYKPERLLAIARLMYDCNDVPFHDELVIIDGSDRMYLCCCIAFAPWLGKAYEITSGYNLERNFAAWVDKATASLDSEYDSDCDDNRKLMQEAISAVCEKYFFDVQAIPTTVV